MPYKKHCYEVQTGCHCCRHVFVRYIQDAGKVYFCDLEEDRPFIYVSELIGKSKEVSKETLDTWDKWATDHEVNHSGFCLLSDEKK